MAFFYDGKNEYFSLSIDPVRNPRPYVFTLTKLQTSISKHLVPYFFVISTGILASAICMVIAEHFDLGRQLLSNSSRQRVVIALACIDAVIAYSEIAFFMWARASQHPPLRTWDGMDCKNITLLKSRSWMAYLIFLLTMIVPFVSLAALPQESTGFIGYAYESGIVARFFLLQLAILLIALSVILTRRVIAIITAIP
jgi:hypothetical protein